MEESESKEPKLEVVEPVRPTEEEIEAVLPEDWDELEKELREMLKRGKLDLQRFELTLRKRSEMGLTRTNQDRAELFGLKMNESACFGSIQILELVLRGIDNIREIEKKEDEHLLEES